MELYARRRFCWATGFWGSVAVALFCVGHFTDNVHWIILALAPGLLAAGTWFFRPREFRGVLGEDGLEVENPGRKIPYSEIQGILMAGRLQDPASPRLKAGPVVITHRGGVLRIPAALNVPITKVYQAVFSRVPLSGSGPLGAEMEGHLRQEQSLFGPERVHFFGLRSCRGRVFLTTRGQVCSFLLMLCGIAWCFAPLAVEGRRGNQDFDPMAWLGFGIMLAFVSLSFLLLLYARANGPPRRKLGRPQLVISPSGIALVQGDLKGHLRWDELRDVRLAERVRGLTFDSRDALAPLQLLIAGAVIRIPDVYDRPLPMIHGLIRRYWKGE